jgi:hypothetical protein
MATRETTGAQREHAWEGRQQTRVNGYLRQEVGRARHPASATTAWLNMAIGVWLFVSAFWLASSSQASWNVGILGAVVFVLAAIASTQTAKSDTRLNQT